MACWKFLLILVLPTAAGFVLDITASSPQHALLGNEVHLRCTFSVAKPPINPLFLAVFWYFQDTEILRYDNKGLSISPRVTFSTEAANNGDVSLSLANVTISDGGLYKCLVIYSPEKMEREVLLEIFVSPVIEIPNKVIQKNKENTLTCMANCFYPVDINIIWLKDNEPLTNSELGKPERNPDGTYRVMGTVILPPMDGKMDHNFSCKVQHASLQQPLQEDFQLEYEDESHSSIIVACGIAVGMLLVGLVMGTIIWNQRRKASLHSSCTVSEIKGPEKLLDGEEATLYCTVSNCPQGDPQVTWIEERSGDQWEIPQCRDSGDPGETEQLLGDSYLITCRKEGLQSYCSSLRFVPRVGKHRDMTLICRFLCTGKTKEKRFHCTKIYAKPVLVSVVPSLCESGEILYSLTLRGFYPRHISITWTCGAGDSQGRILSKEQIEVKPDLTFSVCSEARISGDLYKDPAFRVGVTWEHGSLDAPGYREFSILGPDYSWDPIVEPIQDTKFLHNSPTTLQCNISEYFPDALTVTWLRKGAESEELTEVPNTHPYIRSNKQTDNTYSCTPRLIIYPSVRDQGAEYICRVTHPSLVRPIDTSTGTINVMAKPMFLDPVQMDLLTNGRIQFSITLRNFYPRDIHINWNIGEKEAKFIQTPTNTVTETDELTYDLTSVCSLPGYQFSNPEYKVHVTWNHVTMEAPESRELCVTDFPWRPQVGEIVVPTLGKKKVTLSCEISGYFPDALTVSWFRREKSDQSEVPLSDQRVGFMITDWFKKLISDQSETSLSTRHYKVSEAKSKKEENQTFTCETQLTFSPDQKTDQGAEFICRVGHPGLGQLIERRVGPLVIPE